MTGNWSVKLALAYSAVTAYTLKDAIEKLTWLTCFSRRRDYKRKYEGEESNRRIRRRRVRTDR